VVPAGFTIQIVGNVGGARELAATPNGDLLIGTGGSSVYMIQNASAPNPAAPHVFATVSDAGAAGVTLALQQCAIYVGAENGVYKIPYTIGDQTASAITKIATVRPGGDGGHSTTSVAFTNGTLYASVGSSCNACTESDATRASIQQMGPNGENMTPKAVHIRNAIALAVNPDTGTLWAGVAGQDGLPSGHPYEFFDAVGLRAGVPDYGWPNCEENHNAFGSGAGCSNQTVPLVELPAYSTLIGAAFYPHGQTGAYAFPAQYRGGAFIAAHGSWHQNSNGTYAAAPRVAFVAMNADAPQTPVNWGDPAVQSADFISGFQRSDGTTRIGRPTGVAVAVDGSLFVADDQTGNIYRIRP
jgi:glucose/arabinose dehydrogenase